MGFNYANQRAWNDLTDLPKGKNEIQEAYSVYLMLAKEHNWPIPALDSSNYRVDNLFHLIGLY